MGEHLAAGVRTNVERSDGERRGGGAPATILVASGGFKSSELAVLKVSEYACGFGSRIYQTHNKSVPGSYCGL